MRIAQVIVAGPISKIYQYIPLALLPPEPFDQFLNPRLCIYSVPRLVMAKLWHIT